MSIFSFLPESVKDHLRRRAGAVTMRGRLQNLRAAGFAPRQIIDAGAFRGEWTRMIAEIFPAASLLLIEPQPHLATLLGELCRTLPSARHRAALLGRERGQAHFLVEESNSRIVADPAPWPSESVISIPTETLDVIVASEGFEACDFLKLDLQGHELEALVGANLLLQHVEVILLECSWLPVGHVPIAAEVIGALTARGYRLYDVMGFNYRPLDGALWQTDFLFVREDSRLLARQHDWS